MTNRYGTAEELWAKFSPEKQEEYASKHLIRCFTGEAPTINRVAIAYSEMVIENWLIGQLTDLVLFSQIPEKPSIDSIERIAKVIRTNYGYLKLSEIMVFFQRFKAGFYGKFYGIIDAMTITDALHNFLEYRQSMRYKYL